MLLLTYGILICDMAQLSHDDILGLARLVRLQLTESEVDKFADEINAILGYVEQLKEVDVTGLEPTYQLNNLDNVMREDVPDDYGVDSENLLQNVSDTKDGQVVVKRMIA